MGEPRVVAAWKAFAQRSPASRARLPLAKAADAHFDTKESRGRSPRLLQDLR